MRRFIIPLLLLLPFTMAAQSQTVSASSPSAASNTSTVSNTSTATAPSTSTVLSSATNPSMTMSDASQAPITLAQLQSTLAAEGRSISGASYRELARLEESRGGLSANLWNAEYVFRIGESTFIVDMRLISAITLASLIIVLVLFSPLGFTVFRGGVHALLGSILQFLHIAPEYGEHLRTEPQKWLQREDSARRAFRMYMRNAFIPLYRNNITAIAFLGTAFLIMSIGFRGIKFMVPHQPEMIIMAIIVEITVLCMLGLSTWYEHSEAQSVPEPLPETVRLPNGQYLERDFVMRAIHDVLDDLSTVATVENTERS
ncbi:hypothetical protein KQI65_15740 [bacterium]|nr:hypothetical protein [bacterium]